MYNAYNYNLTQEFNVCRNGALKRHKCCKRIIKIELIIRRYKNLQNYGNLTLAYHC